MFPEGTDESYMAQFIDYIHKLNERNEHDKARTRRACQRRNKKRTAR